MAKEICISSTPHETRLAILEDDQLSEIYYERENEYTLAGSIYNGRVTRVLPGMQSAFVDLGLERDAFLYVTDFIEIEDPEEGDEIERAAASPAPRPVRPGSARTDSSAVAKTEDRRGDQRNDGRNRRPVAEMDAVPVKAIAAPAAAEAEQGEDDSTDESGGRRWRGRRRRRGGGRGADGAAPAPATPSAQGAQPNKGITVEAAGSADIEDDGEVEEIEVQSTASDSGQRGSGRDSERDSQRGSRRDSGRNRDRRGGSGRDSRRETSFDSGSDSSSSAPAVPIVLPGESLSKYGAKTEEPQKSEAKSEPVRSASTFKPTTLIDAPIVWDGMGLLPGETLSRYKKSEPAEPEVSTTFTEPSAIVADDESVEDEELETEETESSEFKKPEIEEDEFEVEESESIVHHAAPSTHSYIETVADEDTTEETYTEELHSHVALTHESVSEEETTKEPTSEATTEENRSASHNTEASHNVDPLPPSGFRLFGFGKKKEEKKPARASNYSPGVGNVEEEEIDEEEYVTAPRLHARAGDSDQDDLEEETLRAQIGSGALGEMFQEAHLDHRIQRNFDGPSNEEEEDEGATSTDPARQDRNQRGGARRGRSGSSGGGPRRGGPSRRSAQTTDLPIISDLLKPGQEILVQIAKEPIAKKGARITSHIALPGRFLVFMPTVSHVGVSRKISSDEERHRLKRILVSERGEATGGFIVRTAAEHASEEELRADLRFLLHLWSEIKNRSEGSKSPALIYHDLSLIERILRDQVSDNFSSIWVDSEADYERIVRFLNRFSPTLVRRVKLYSKDVPLFEHFGIQEEISKALRSKVWLKSGGSIVINQTEALVAIDINTGKYVGKTARLEDTILKTNLDAIPEIVRQIRLRDLGGIIVIDFIDMDERKNRNKVMAALEDALKVDRAPTKVLQFNDFGLVAITRKRVKQSLERTLSVPCPVCQATGMVKSPATVANEIFIELRKMKKHFESGDVLVRVHPETVKVLKASNASWIADYEELVGKNILIKSDPTLHPEQFDIQG
jgi:ribonuclease E